MDDGRRYAPPCENWAMYEGALQNWNIFKGHCSNQPMPVTFRNNSKPISYPQHCPTADTQWCHISSPSFLSPLSQRLQLLPLRRNATVDDNTDVNTILLWRSPHWQYNTVVNTVVKIPLSTKVLWILLTLLLWILLWSTRLMFPPIDKSIVNRSRLKHWSHPYCFPETWSTFPLFKLNSIRVHWSMRCVYLYYLSSYLESIVIKSTWQWPKNPLNPRFNLEQLVLRREDKIRATWQRPQALLTPPCSTSSPPPPTQP